MDLKLLHLSVGQAHVSDLHSLLGHTLRLLRFGEVRQRKETLWIIHNNTDYDDGNHFNNTDYDDYDNGNHFNSNDSNHDNTNNSHRPSDNALLLQLLNQCLRLEHLIL